MRQFFFAQLASSMTELVISIVVLSCFLLGTKNKKSSDNRTENRTENRTDNRTLSSSDRSYYSVPTNDNTNVSNDTFKHSKR